LYNPVIEKYGTESWSWQYYTFGLQFESIASTLLDLEIPGFYKAQFKINARPFYFVPFELWTAFVRPDALVLGDQGE
jgi:hypothetical protein